MRGGTDLDLSQLDGLRQECSQEGNEQRTMDRSSVAKQEALEARQRANKEVTDG